MYLFIEDDKSPDYLDLHNTLREEKFVALDTEFERRNTYFAKPSLIQIGASDRTYIVDLVKVSNVEPIKNLIENPSILKVLHSAEQDLEIFMKKDIKIKNYFDTQIAMQFLNMKMGLGFESLIAHIFGEGLEKSYQRSNWMKRPLEEGQLLYAAQDVIMLRKAYLYLEKKLIEKSKDSYKWCIEESKSMIPEKNDIKSTILKLFAKIAPKLSKQSQKIKAFHLLTYRELRALQEDKSRKRVIKDENLLTMAKRNRIPTAIQDFINTSSNNEDALKALKQVESMRSRLNSKELEKSEKLMHKILEIAKKYDLPKSLIATQKDISLYIQKEESSKLNHGWRSKLLSEIR